MKELFRLGNISIYLFGVTIALGILAGIGIMLKEAKRKELNTEKMYDLVMYTIIVAMVGARLYYVLAFNPKYYLKNPMEILLVHQGGLSIQGALIAGILVALWYVRKNNLNFWKVADTFAPGIILGQAIGRIGCDVFGIPMKTIYPWGVRVGSQILHPAQLYEVFLDLILFTYLWKGRGKSKYNGEIFIKYIIGFSINRGIVEFFRTNPMVFKPFSIAHVTSLIIIIIALIVNQKIKSKSLEEKEIVANNTVTVGFADYSLILGIAVIGTWFYYFIH